MPLRYYGLPLLHLFKYIHFNYATTLLRFTFATLIQIYSFQLRYYGLPLLHLFKYIHFNYATKKHKPLSFRKITTVYFFQHLFVYVHFNYAVIRLAIKQQQKGTEIFAASKKKAGPKWLKKILSSQNIFPKSASLRYYA